MVYMLVIYVFCFFFFNDTATTEIYTLSLHDALPISPRRRERARARGGARCGDPGRERTRGGEARRRRELSHRRLRAGGAAPRGRLRRALRRSPQGREPAGARLAGRGADGGGRCLLGGGRSGTGARRGAHTAP